MLDLSRQTQIIRFDPDRWPLLIIGAGGIGSSAAYVAACMGFTDITIYEPDVVEAENIAPQLYAWPDVGRPKTDALRENVSVFTGVELKVRPELYARQAEQAKIVLVAVDSIEARRRIWKHNRIKDKLYWLDGRMGKTLCSVYSVKLNDPISVAGYETSLRQPHSELACGEKATAFITKGVMQGMLGTALYHIVTEKSVPFMQINDALTMYSEVIWSAEGE